MTVRVGINGFGRIGRNFYRALRSREAGIEVVAVNDLGSPEVMAHLLRRDSVLGPAPWEISAADGGISIDGELLPVLAQRDPATLPWGDLGVQVVVESTGFFTSRDRAAAHLDAGAERVVISAPAKDVDATFVVGVNDDTFDPDSHRVVSNASCTTNCFVPMVKVLDDAFGVVQGFMSTVHAYTGDQMLVDGPHGDLRRTRAAAVNIIPTSTGAARATGLVLDAMAGRLDGIALRVPVADGSLTDFTATLERPAGAAEGERRLRAGGRRGAAGGSAGVLRRAARLHRHRGLGGLVRLRLGAHHGRRQPGEGVRLVRQRVGLLQPARGPRGAHRRLAAAE